MGEMKKEIDVLREKLITFEIGSMDKSYNMNQ